MGSTLLLIVLVLLAALTGYNGLTLADVLALLTK